MSAVQIVALVVLVLTLAILFVLFRADAGCSAPPPELTASERKFFNAMMRGFPLVTGVDPSRKTRKRKRSCPAKR